MAAMISTYYRTAKGVEWLRKLLNHSSRSRLVTLIQNNPDGFIRGYNWDKFGVQLIQIAD